MKLTKQQMKFIKDNEEMFKAIITNKAFSNLSYTFKNTIEDIAELHKLNSCKCNSGFITAVTRIWQMYIDQKIAEKAEKNNNKTKQATNDRE